MSKITYGAWVGLDEKAGEGNLQFQQVESKAADPDDIDGESRQGILGGGWGISAAWEVDG